MNFPVRTVESLIEFAISFFHRLNVGKSIFNLSDLIMIVKIKIKERGRNETGIYTRKKNYQSSLSIKSIIILDFCYSEVNHHNKSLFFIIKKMTLTKRVMILINCSIFHKKKALINHT